MQRTISPTPVPPPPQSSRPSQIPQRWDFMMSNTIPGTRLVPSPPGVADNQSGLDRLALWRPASCPPPPPSSSRWRRWTSSCGSSSPPLSIVTWSAGACSTLVFPSCTPSLDVDLRFYQDLTFQMVSSKWSMGLPTYLASSLEIAVLEVKTLHSSKVLNSENF